MTSKLTELIKLAFDTGAMRKLVFSQPLEGEIRRVVGRLAENRGRRLLALEYSLPGDTVKHKNLTRDEVVPYIGELISAYRQINLITDRGEAELRVTKSGKPALLGGDKLLRALTDGGADFERAIETLDKKKNYILSGSEDFLISLGVSDKSGRVHDKKQGKFRQINRFLEHVEGIYGNLPAEGTLLVYDLCCGKSYLSFALYYYLTAVKGRSVDMLGVDLKRDVIRWCEAEAERLGYVGMRFAADDIKNIPSDRRPDLVVSLHACDVATDIVINRAIELSAGVILSTPCCHRYLNDRIDMAGLEFVTRHPHLRNKLCEAVTDAIRLARLEAAGYKVSAPELTDPDDTPKNTLIRAIRTGTPERTYESYEEILKLVLGGKTEGYLKGM